MSKYYNQEQFKSYKRYKDLSFQLIQSDTYSEDAIEEMILKSGNPELLQVAALQMAIVGTGNKTLGSIIFKGEKYDLDLILPKLGVKTNLGEKSNLKHDDLTPRRLQRFFRYCIKDYLVDNQHAESYLFRKYSDNNPRFRSSCFPGSEHLVSDNEEACYMIETYLNVDKQLGTNITERIIRVLVAKTMLSMNEAREIVASTAHTKVSMG